MYIPENILEDIKTRSNIVDVINSYVPLTQQGRDWKACCPFHHEKTPSFTVNTDKNMFYCFGCKKGGNVISFVMEHENVDFPTASRILAQKANIIIPETTSQGHQLSQAERTEIKHKAIEKDRMYQLYDLTTKFYQKELMNNPNSLLYKYLFEERKITKSIAEKFQIGVAPDAWHNLIDFARLKDFSEKNLLTAGLARINENKGNYYDWFRNRLTFPILDEQGRVVAFSARTIEQNTKMGKYINSPETLIFSKKRVLYALSLARTAIRDNGYAILCEGQIDVIAMHNAGFENAVSSQGTAFGVEQVLLLKRYTNQVFVAFDADSAGIKATISAIDDLLSNEIQTKVVCFNQGEDPDDIFRNQGKDGIANYINNAIDFFDFLYNFYTKQFNVNDPYDKIKISDAMIEHISKLKDSKFVDVRNGYVSQLAARLNIMERGLFQKLNELSKTKTYNRNVTKNTNDTEVPQQSIEVSDAIRDAEINLLELVISTGVFGEKLFEKLPPEMVSTTPVGLALDEAISMTVNGEWEFIEDHLIDNVNTFGSGHTLDDLMKVLIKKKKIKSHDEEEKILSECLVTIKKEHLQKEINITLSKAKDAQTQEENDKYITKYRELSKELRKCKNGI